MAFLSSTSESGVAPSEYWRREVNALTQDARTILGRVIEAQRIYRANKLAELIAATPAGMAVPGTTISKEQAMAWALMVEAVATFLTTELQNGFTIEDGLYAVWPAPQAPDEATS